MRGLAAAKAHDCEPGLRLHLRARTFLRSSLPLLLLPLQLVNASCSGPQSALNPAGKGAESIADLFWWMVGGATLVWLLVVGLLVYAVLLRPQAHDMRSARLYIIGGGVLLPTVTLTALLAYGLSLLPELIQPAPEGSLVVRVSGEQWWWRVQYEAGEGTVVELANEIRLPVGEPVEFHLTAPDVIHSFWIPALGPKMDMIPGRTNRLTLHPTREGVFRGACAEFCGSSHAFMAFDVVVMSQADFDQWLQEQATPATMPPQQSIAGIGQQYFLRNGCGACHNVRGSPADGFVGPDLTHVGSRLSIGAGILPNDAPGFTRFLKQTDHLKPGVYMPHFRMLPKGEIDAIAAYLDSLE